MISEWSSASISGLKANANTDADADANADTDTIVGVFQSLGEQADRNEGPQASGSGE